MEATFITAILVMATTKNSPFTSHKMCEQISHYVGKLNCEINDEVAMVRYDGILSSENKNKLQDVAKENNFTLLFLEAEEDTEWIKDETIHVPSKSEMREHLNWN
jgi:hypothetical protein